MDESVKHTTQGGMPVKGERKSVPELLSYFTELEATISQFNLATRELLEEDNTLINLNDEIVLQFLNFKVAVENKDFDQAENGTGPYLKAIYEGIDRYINWQRQKTKAAEA